MFPLYASVLVISHKESEVQKSFLFIDDIFTQQEPSMNLKPSKLQIWSQAAILFFNNNTLVLNNSCLLWHDYLFLGCPLSQSTSTAR